MPAFCTKIFHPPLFFHSLKIDSKKKTYFFDIAFLNSKIPCSDSESEQGIGID
jgi:hypothetical protein